MHRHRNFIVPFGFQGFFDMLEDVNSIEKIFQDKNHFKNYPPANIFSEDQDQKFTIELAVAGWIIDELKVIIKNNNDLLISGTRDNSNLNDTQKRIILSGIASRNFTKEFTFSKPIQEIEVGLENGILTVNVSLKENLKQIEIKNNNKKDK